MAHMELHILTMRPSIFIEFARDCGIAARKKGLFNVFVSNGYDTPESVS